MAAKGQLNLSVDIIIPVYHPDEKFYQLLKMLEVQTKKPEKILILHTVEDYQEESLPLPELNEIRITVHPVKKQNFDHGGTRKLGAVLCEADLLMLMTQDAIPADEFLIKRLLEPYRDQSVAATYARQLPNEKADLVELYTRSFNYPKKSMLKSGQDIERLGIKAFFCSNVCATYRRDIYGKLGGFVEKTIFNEDMILAHKILQAGYRIAYAADAKVIHSHKYSYFQQFTRNFDLGVSHRQYAEIFKSVSSESEGRKLVKQTLRFLIDKKKYLLIPDLILSSGFKYLGYLLGEHYDNLPKRFVIFCSMNKGYWK